jgi:hypothetical protein
MRNVRPRFDRRPHWNFVEIAAVNADDRDHAEVAAAMDCLAQHVRPVRSEINRRLHPIEHRIGARGRFGLGSNRVDAGVGAASVGQLLDALVDVLFREIDRLRARLLRKRQPLGDGVDGDDPAGAEKDCAF